MPNFMCRIAGSQRGRQRDKFAYSGVNALLAARTKRPTLPNIESPGLQWL